jgi:Uma2 family endonuclease
MAEPARRRATFEDLLAAPPHTIAQIVDGELYVMPRPAGPHALVASGLGIDLGGAFQRGRGGPGGWIFLHEPELHFGADVVVPDLAGWRAERVPALNAPFFTTAPDWVCEVLSRRHAKLDRGPKAEVYAREEVEFLWLVDPEETCIEAYSRLDGRWVRLGAWSGDSTARIPPFDAVAIDLAPLWVSTTEG